MRIIAKVKTKNGGFKWIRCSHCGSLQEFNSFIGAKRFAVPIVKRERPKDYKVIFKRVD